MSQRRAQDYGAGDRATHQGSDSPILTAESARGGEPKLKRLLAEAALDNDMRKDVAAKKSLTLVARREAAAHLGAILRGE